MNKINHKDQRVAVFIDTQNLYHSAKNLYKAKVNFKEVLNRAVSGRKLIRAFAYVVRTESGEESAFLEALENLGLQVRSKDLQVFAGGSKKADWDVGLAVDAISVAPKMDTIVIVSGDGDFVPLVEYLKMHDGCQVEAISFGKSSSSRLKEIVDKFYDLDDDATRFLIKNSSWEIPLFKRSKR